MVRAGSRVRHESTCFVRIDPDPLAEFVIAGAVIKPRRDLFITSAAKSEPMPVIPKGYEPTSGNLGGQLYRINLAIPGKEEHRTQLRRIP